MAVTQEFHEIVGAAIVGAARRTPPQARGQPSRHCDVVVAVDAQPLQANFENCRALAVASTSERDRGDQNRVPNEHARDRSDTTVGDAAGRAARTRAITRAVRLEQRQLRR